MLGLRPIYIPGNYKKVSSGGGGTPVITRLNPWVVSGPTSNYGLASSLSGTAATIPANSLIVSTVYVQDTTTPSVSDTAGNAFTLLPGHTNTNSAGTSVWMAYCLNSKAQTNNIVTWTYGSTALTVTTGCYYSLTNASWFYDTSVAGDSAYATTLNMTFAANHIDVIFGGFSEFYAVTETWTISGLTQQAVYGGSTSGNGNCGGLAADLIATTIESSLAITVSDNTGTYSGKIGGYVAGFYAQ